MILVYLGSFALLEWLKLLTSEPYAVCRMYVYVFLYNFILVSCVIKVKEIALSVNQKCFRKRKRLKYDNYSCLICRLP